MTDHLIHVETKFDPRYMQPIEEVSDDVLLKIGERVYKKALRESVKNDPALRK